MRLSRAWIGLTALIAMVGGCGKPPAPAIEPESPGAEVAVTIENHGWVDVVVLYSHNGIWERVGTAAAARTTSFTIPWRKFAAGGVTQLKADPTDGGQPVLTSQLVLTPGKLVVWTLERRLEQSSVAVY